MGLTRKHFTVVFLCLCFTVFLLLISVSSSSSPQGQMETAASRSLEHDNGVHCSRERSRAAWKIIDEYLMPFVEKERYKISSRCRLHPENDLYRDQEQHKMHVDINEWRCGYCKKTFYEEKYLDKHFDNRHYDLLNVSHSRCLADLCGALHCDLVLDSAPHKTRCNPAAIGRNKHLCESLADSCFPVSEGPSALHLNEFFLRQFCDAHTCSGGRKPFSKGGKRETSTLHVVISVLVLMLLALFYIFMGIKRSSQGLKHISKSGQKKRS
ncbi:ZINC FINGER PROTEIN-RELATED [Salix purpurea]|uniref:ZINC FINGER PROTEIN-RELATED n=1 Tax=Salix purpurea TaxID=77065 RepID=A0A9Q1A1B7_SALPP|nr:ZINC FINGER PROTEIN-RELATED [Salix purpurea]